MLSKRQNAQGLKEKIKSYQEQLEKAKLDFMRQSNEVAYGDESLDPLGEHLIDLYSTVKKVADEISNLITGLALDRHVVSIPLLEVSIQYSAFLLFMVENSIKLYPTRMAPLMKADLDINFFTITDYFGLRNEIDSSIQADIYYMYVIFRYLRANGPEPAAKNTHAVTLSSEKYELNNVLTKFIQSRQFVPEEYLVSLISRSTPGLTKMLAIRSLIFECATTKPKQWQDKILKCKSIFDEAFEAVAKSEISKNPTTAQEYNQLFDLIHANAIYSQVKLIFIYIDYRKKHHIDINIETQFAENNFEVLFLQPGFEEGSTIGELENFFLKEDMLHQVLNAINLIEHIDFTQIPADHRLHSKIHDIVIDCEWRAMSNSLFTSLLFNAIAAEKLYASPYYDKLLSYLNDKRNLHFRWQEIDERYHQDYVKRIFGNMIKVSSNNQIARASKSEDDFKGFMLGTSEDLMRLDKNQAKKKLASEKADSAINFNIQEQHGKVQKLKDKSDELFKSFSKATVNRKKLLKKVASMVTSSNVSSPVVEEVSDEDLPIIHLTEATPTHHVAIQHLEKLELRLDSFGRALAGRVKKIYQILLDRIQAKKALNDNGMISLDDAIKMAIDDMNQLLHLRTEYVREVKQAGDLKEFSHAATISIGDIDAIIIPNQKILTSSIEMLQNIVNRSKEKMEIYTHQRIMKMGWAKFIEAYQQKGPSRLTLERRYLEEMINVYTPKITVVNKTLISTGLNVVVATTELSEVVRRAHVAIEDVPGKSYLVGGVAIKILKGKPISMKDDLDFASTCSKASQIMDADPQFYNAEKKRRLFQLRKDDLNIDLYSADPEAHYLDETEWMKADASTRNYTINAIYIDYLGNVFDPTGNGLHDLKHNILRAINDPVVMLEKDASCIFAAFKRMVEGFKPDKDLEAALQSWKRGPYFQSDHVYSVVNKHLKSMSDEDCLKYTGFIFKYNMHEKIFGFRSVESNDNLLIKIKKIIETEKSSYQPTFFAEKDQSNASVTQVGLKL